MDETTWPGASVSSTRVENFHHQRHCSMHLDAQILKSSLLHEPIIHHEYNTGFTRNGRVRVLLGQEKEEDLECGRGLGWEAMVGKPVWTSSTEVRTHKNQMERTSVNWGSDVNLTSRSSYQSSTLDIFAWNDWKTRICSSPRSLLLVWVVLLCLWSIHRFKKKIMGQKYI